MRVFTRQIVAAWVLLQCAIAIALAPIVPQLHLAFASHAHVYCVQHRRLEDAGAKTNSASGQPRLGNLRGLFAAQQGTPGMLDDASRHACPFSNSVLVTTTPECPSFARCAWTVAGDIERCTLAEAVPVAILYVAPKQSPPACLEPGTAFAAQQAALT